MLVRLGPDHEDIRQRAVGNPHLGAVQHIAALHVGRRGFHAAGVGTSVRFGQTKATDELA